ncbi:acyl-CoA synthetase (AMP-forming)/AMP-acid ligase II [Cylindrospermum stagnale PCC 7417]|uniref:Acyl-CoA synthetase (AMP-forming)/AMP-acid ligase II n=1 Tax=Cylindrospermum stagnale PCC 7417 TaxID=56107 RepID=K9X372_9NOST|nr:alpha/beta fold hydrolase [Cylindrospermum stagnale]AFZ26137.1 acyl-CoA synthetase (AMP-forming)/AMP-acid ligase II [Cylindrospermum stagnale PCC 7417]
MKIQHLDISESIIGSSENLTIVQLLTESVKRNPEATSITAPDRLPLTYIRLDEQIQETIAILNSQGLGLGDRIAIVLPNGPEMAVAFLAVTACATSAPLNPGYSAAEFDFYLSDLNAKALIVQSGIDSPARLAAATRNIPILELVPQLDAEAGVFQLIGETNLPKITKSVVKNQDIALVLHTSGTTARPKIVPLTQANLYISAQNIKNVLELKPSDRCLNIMPLFHIHGLSTVFSSLAAVSSVVCTPGFDATKFFKWLEVLQPTWYTAVPTLHQAILAEVEANRSLSEKSSFRFIRSASSALPPQVLEALELAFNVPVIESYGMTEAAPQIASNPVPPKKRKVHSVGMAAGPAVAIIDEAGNFQAEGEIGEIVIQGSNVTQGYENNPQANFMAFANGWLKTGDLGYLDSDGYLFVTGRLKEQINRGGEKISPREIEEVLLDYPGVAEAVTFAVPHPTLGEDIAAAIVLRQNAHVTEKEIRAFVATKLAEFKVPTQVVFLAEIPKGSTGKLQRIGLAKKLASQLKIIYIAPRTETEKALAAIWAEVLGIEKVGIYDNFFALGGDSLQALRLFAEIDTRLGKTLSISTLIAAPTVDQLADIINHSKGSESWSSLVAIQPRGSKPPLFLIHAIFGDVLFYRDLARHFSPEQPIYALQALGLNKNQTPHNRIEDMAACYLQEIQTIQPQGPYFLGGHSFGGIVAYEIAQQLRRQGQEVAMLVLIDTSAPGSKDRLPLLNRLPLHLKQLLQQGPAYIFQRTLAWNKLLQSRLQKVFYKTCLVFRLSLNRDLRKLYVKDSNKQAQMKYALQIYPNPVIILRVEDQMRIDLVGNKTAPDLGWGNFVTGKLEIFYFSGSHTSIVQEPHVQEVAEQLQACLEQVQLGR